jgi:hypothetical protein
LWELRLVVEVVVLILILYLMCLILYLIWLVILKEVQTPPLRPRRQELQVVGMEHQVVGHLVATVLTVSPMVDLVVKMNLLLRLW